MNKFIRPEPRPLTQEDQTLLEWLIADGQPTRQPVRITDCGSQRCWQMHVWLPHDRFGARGPEAKKTAPSEILADFVGRTPEGIEVGVVLHAREGEISELEVYAISDVKEPFKFPSIESLKPF